MAKYKIADINILMENSGEKTEKRAQKYLYDYEGEPQMKLRLEEDTFEGLYESCLQKTKYPREQFTLVDYIHSLYSNGFSHKILEHRGCVLHSSAVAVGEEAYLFSAHSGTGKSTHTALWLEYFKEKAQIVNDDKPCIREVDGELFVYGTPWSGKHDISVNARFKLKAITFISRSEENWIREATKEEAVSLFLTQTYRPRDKAHMELLLSMIDEIFGKVKIYRLGCNMDIEAAKMAYEYISR